MTSVLIDRAPYKPTPTTDELASLILPGSTKLLRALFLPAVYNVESGCQRAGLAILLDEPSTTNDGNWFAGEGEEGEGGEGEEGEQGEGEEGEEGEGAEGEEGEEEEGRPREGIGEGSEEGRDRRKEVMKGGERREARRDERRRGTGEGRDGRRGDRSASSWC
ncbi:unnamed protein product [Closterium sp. Yama58-4]|nr:unnamed protein product [Closterium sp. Yama58-4]